MLDGYVARRTNSESELGARLDSIADLVLVIVCLVKLLPAIDVPIWLWAWVAAIALVKVANVASGLVVEKRLVMPHTIANKAASSRAQWLRSPRSKKGISLDQAPLIQQRKDQPIRARRANVTKAHASSRMNSSMARRAQMPTAMRMARRTMRKAIA